MPSPVALAAISGSRSSVVPPRATYGDIRPRGSRSGPGRLLVRQLRGPINCCSDYSDGNRGSITRSRSRRDRSPAKPGASRLSNREARWSCSSMSAVNQRSARIRFENMALGWAIVWRGQRSISSAAQRSRSQGHRRRHHGFAWDLTPAWHADVPSDDGGRVQSSFGCGACHADPEA